MPPSDADGAERLLDGFPTRTRPEQRAARQQADTLTLDDAVDPTLEALDRHDPEDGG